MQSRLAPEGSGSWPLPGSTVTDRGGRRKGTSTHERSVDLATRRLNCSACRPDSFCSCRDEARDGELDKRRDEVDRLKRLLYEQLLSRPGIIDVDAAIDLTMAARCYERYVDLAVAVANYGALHAMGTPRH
jgi:hypothetical protein